MIFSHVIHQEINFGKNILEDTSIFFVYLFILHKMDSWIKNN